MYYSSLSIIDVVVDRHENNFMPALKPSAGYIHMLSAGTDHLNPSTSQPFKAWFVKHNCKHSSRTYLRK